MALFPCLLGQRLDLLDLLVLVIQESALVWVLELLADSIQNGVDDLKGQR